MGIVHPDVVRAEGAEIAERLAEEDRLIEAFGLADLLPEFPQDDNYQALQEWRRQMGRGPVTRAGMIEAYRRGYRAARREGIRLGLKAAVVEAQKYADKCRASGRFKVAMSFVTHAEDILALNPDTIAEEAK